MNNYTVFSRKSLNVICTIVFIFFIWIDLASTLQNPATVKAIPVSQLKRDGVAADYRTQVATVRSDDSFMNPRQPLSAQLTREEIIRMVYRVLNLSGDLLPKLIAGAKITLKPNIVEIADLESGVNTDPRVVEGVIRWMEEKGPGNLHYTIAEGGGGWRPLQWKGTKYDRAPTPLGDAFEQSGYYDMRDRLAADGIQATIRNSDFGTLDEPLKGIRFTLVPDFIDFPEKEGYWVNEAFLDPDLLIDVPVMKTHTPQITICLKNYIGTAAGAKYGTYKAMGGPEESDPKLHVDWPSRNSIEHEIVDLAAISPPDYCLVDALIGKERSKTGNDPSVRRNMLIAGPDLVAVDTVCAQLMGLNPDNIPHLCTAAREGLGSMNMDQITVVGEHSIDDSMYYFERTPATFQGNRGHFGQSNRTWSINSIAGSDINKTDLGTPDEQLIATPGVNGWTEPIYFSDDFIDFKAYYNNTGQSVFYAFCWITIPEEQDAELWISHDESCAVWIGGVKVYSKVIRYQEAALPGSSAQTVHLKKGRFPLLVKLVDTAKTAPFVMNICRILPAKLPAGKATSPDLSVSTNYAKYEGTRIIGLKFDVVSSSGISYWGHGVINRKSLLP